MEGHVPRCAACDLSRMTRDLIDQERLIRACLDAGTQWVSLKERLDTASPWGRAVLRFAGTVNQLERELVQERTVFGLRARRDKGLPVGGQPPYGWRRTDGALQEDAREQECLQAMQAHLDAQQGATAIAKSLNAAGWRRRNGHPWTRSAVTRSLEANRSRP